MPIESIALIVALPPADRVAAYQQSSVDKVKAEPPPKAPFQPAPPLRPTIEDKISIDKALLALRPR